MTEIEKIERYIRLTGYKANPKYELTVCEAFALRNKLNEDTFSALELIFHYGMAKGYRAAKAEGKA